MQREIKPLKEWLEGHARHEPCTLVLLHATAGGNLSGAIETLKAEGYSYNFIIDHDGTITKCIPLDWVGYHAGSSWGPHEKARGVSNRQRPSDWKFVAGCSVNPYSVGISFVNLNDGHQKVTQAQTDAAIWLVGEIRKQHPITEVTTHAIVSPHRKSDPIGYDLDAFAKATGLKAWRP